MPKEDAGGIGPTVGSAASTADPEAPLAPNRTACLAFDPLPFVDAVERIGELAVRAQSQAASHVVQSALTMALFAANRAIAQMEAARSIAAAPGPMALPAIWAHLAAGSVSDAAEEARRLGHVATRAVGEAGEQTRTATQICMAAGRPADID